MRALRTGVLDLAPVSSRPPHVHPTPDDPPLHEEPLLEDRLVLAAPVDGRFTDRACVTARHIADETWFADTAEPLPGIWPGLSGRPRGHAPSATG